MDSILEIDPGFLGLVRIVWGGGGCFYIKVGLLHWF